MGSIVVSFCDLGNRGFRMVHHHCELLWQVEGRRRLRRLHSCHGDLLHHLLKIIR